MDFSGLNILSELSLITYNNDKIINKYKKDIQNLETNYTELVSRLTKLEKIVLNKSHEEQGVETNIIKPITKKRNREEIIRDEYIRRLIHAKKISRNWEQGMSKYLTITHTPQSRKWLWQSHIFNEPNTYFDTRNEAEQFYENILKKHDIPLEYIIRKEYNEKKDS
jgi:hypothetical protein